MKKSLFLVAFVSLFLLLASPIFSVNDGTKTLIGKETGVVIQVPECNTM